MIWEDNRTGSEGDWKRLLDWETLFVLQGRAEQGVNLLGGLFLHPFQNVAIPIERYPDAAVSEPFRYDLWVHAKLQ